MTEFKAIQMDCPHFLGSYAIGHVGQGVIGEGEQALRKHYHGNQYELTYILEGEGISYHDDIPQPVQAGDIFVSFPYEYHKVEVKNGSVIRQKFVTFSVNDGKYFEKLAHLWFINIAPDNRVFQDKHVGEIIDKIVEETEQNADYAEDMLALFLQELVLRLLRGMQAYEPQMLSTHPTQEDLCRHVAHYIDTHLFTIKNVSEVADAINYNYSYLSACFRKTTGQTINAYYSQKRLQTAKALIREQRMTLTEIARTLGYSGIYSFSKAFRDCFGIAPSEYRDKIRE